MGRQLTLPVALKDEAIFSNFYGQQDIVNCLRMFLNLKGEHFICLVGKSGTGKSHLLQACCHQSHQQQLSASYLPLSKIKLLSPEVLENLESLDLICLDEIEAIAGNKVWEEALFHFYNRIQESNARLLIAVSASPKQLPFKLPDLISRLMWGLTLNLHELSDKDKLKALQLHAKMRGLQLENNVAEFLFNRLSRDMNSLCVTLDKLDQASLVNQRRLTIPFIKSSLLT